MSGLAGCSLAAPTSNHRNSSQYHHSVPILHQQVCLLRKHSCSRVLRRVLYLHLIPLRLNACASFRRASQPFKSIQANRLLQSASSLSGTCGETRFRRLYINAPYFPTSASLSLIEHGGQLVNTEAKQQRQAGPVGRSSRWKGGLHIFPLSTFNILLAIPAELSMGDTFDRRLPCSWWLYSFICDTLSSHQMTKTPPARRY